MKRVAIDFDGVIHDYRGGWQGYGAIPGEAVPGVVEDILRLRAAGYSVAVVTSRALDAEGAEAVREWLRRRGLEVGRDIEEVTALKLPAMAYFDDRGVTFRPGMDLLEAVRAFTPWMNASPIESALE
jgi:hypothetical protein